MVLIILYILSFIIVLLLFLALLFGYLLNRKTTVPKMHSYDGVYKELSERGDYYGVEPDTYHFDEVSISSRYGYELYGRWYPCAAEAETQKTVIIVHGYTVNLMCSLRYLDLFYSKGYNVLMYDHRSHGRSKGERCSLGYYERHDLITCIDWVMQKVGGSVGLHGESMGASTSILTAAMDDRIAFVVADCGYASLYDELKFQLKTQYKIPGAPFIFFANVFNRLFFKHRYQDVSPIKALEDVHVPVLFIHGEDDEVTPVESSIDMYNAYDGEKELYVQKNTRHAETIRRDRAKYYDAVYNFLEKYSL